MQIAHQSRNRGGFASIAAVVALSLLIVALLLTAFRRAMVSQSIERTVQLQVDYTQKEDAFVRGVVGQVPDAVVGMMQINSSSDPSDLRWNSIFEEAGAIANIEDSDEGFLATISKSNAINVNVGDVNLNDYSAVVSALGGVSEDTAGGAGTSNVQSAISVYASKLPPTLDSGSGFSSDLANNYPTLSPELTYGASWNSRVEDSGTLSVYDQFNSIPYPSINFGYAAPGSYFIAKHNWWAFEVDFSDPDSDVTGLPGVKRRYCLSLYEVPSQLPISAAGFARFGQFADGSDWAGVSVDANAGVYAEDAELVAGSVGRVSARRGINLNGGSVTGVDNQYTGKYGREQFQVDTNGSFLPISLSADSGRVAFFPVNSGSLFFDLYAADDQAYDFFDYQDAAGSVQGDYHWAEYSRGAGKCAMRLVVTQVADRTDQTPQEIEFSYIDTNGVRQSIVYAPGGGSGVEDWPSETSPEGATFPFHLVGLPNGETRCLAIYAERIPAFLANITGADGTDVNHSLVVNVDHRGNDPGEPTIPVVPNPNGAEQITVALREAEDLNGFTRGFSLVTNMRLYVDGDVNTTPGSAPVSYSGTYYPPASIFASEIRYGSDNSNTAVNVAAGRLGRLGRVTSDTDANRSAIEIRSGDTDTDALITSGLTANLTAIRHPAEVPPVSAMNWLIVAETIAD